jgi:hypothetical protein
MRLPAIVLALLVSLLSDIAPASAVDLSNQVIQKEELQGFGLIPNP